MNIKTTWLGTGKMGGYMAANLARGGFTVTAWNRTPGSEGMRIAVEGGCSEAASLEQALTAANVVLSCVSDAAALDSIYTASNIQLLQAGTVVVDCSTIGPEAARALADRLARLHLHFVDAPVTGGDIGAKNGTLTFMAGGRETDVESVKNLLHKMGKQVVHAGAVGCGQALKLVNQLLCAQNLLAVTEAFEAAHKLGLPPEMIVTACSGGAAASWQLINLGPKIARGDDKPGFKVAHMSKDLNLLRAALGPDAEQLTCFPLVAQAFATLNGPSFKLGERGTEALALNLKEVRKEIP